MPQWQREYIEGSQLEVYMVRLPECFHGLSFHQASTCRVLCLLYSPLHLDRTLINPYKHKTTHIIHRTPQIATQAYAQLDGAVLLLGVEERALRLDDGPGGLRGSVAPHKHANNFAVRRVLINPGGDYRMVVQPPLLEVGAMVIIRMDTLCTFIFTTIHRNYVCITDLGLRPGGEPAPGRAHRGHRHRHHAKAAAAPGRGA